MGFCPDGKRLVTGGADGWIRVWDVETCKPLNTFRDRDGFIGALALSPDGRQAVTTGDHGLVNVWELKAGKKLRQIVGHEGNVNAVLSFDSHGRYVVTAGHDKTIRLWEVETGKEFRRFLGHPHGNACVSFLPCGTRALSSSGGTIFLWDVATGKELHRLEKYRDDRVSKENWADFTAVSPDGRLALSGSGDKIVRLWRLPDPLAK